MLISLNEFTCPHCSKENATMFDSSNFLLPLNHSLLGMVFSCRSCGHSVILELDEEASKYYKNMLHYKLSSTLVVNNKFIATSDKVVRGKVISIYPEQKKVTAPLYLSDIVSKNFKEAKELFNQKYFNPSAMTSRRTIDLATKELLPTDTGMLNGRIKNLLINNIITQQLSEWADIIRLDGNSANHAFEDFTEEQAGQLLDFTEMFLMYAFTLPKMVAIKRESSNEND